MPPWASSSGADEYGHYADLAIRAGDGEVMTQRLRWIARGKSVMAPPDAHLSTLPVGQPLPTVTIVGGFWMCDTPCTQAFWRAIMVRNPSQSVDPRRPVETVSLEDALAFLTRLNVSLHGAYARLPSEAEWDYADRAGLPADSNADTMDHAGDMMGWAESHPVRQGRPNRWGLFDMRGNVSEWCADHWHSSHEGAPTDGSAWLGDGAAANHVVRGGSWGSPAQERRGYGPGSRLSSLGFRCVIVG